MRLDLERTARSGLIEAEVSLGRYRELRLAVREQVSVRPRAVRVFVS